MDKTVKRRSIQPARRIAGPVVVLANWYQFGSDELAVRPCVESRMLLWCHQGKGRLSVNGTDFRFVPGDWVLLPWKHRIVYEADRKDPFLVGGIHVIPSHDARSPVQFRVAHRMDDPIADDKARHDTAWLGLDGVVRHSETANTDPLLLLARYIVESYQRAAPERNLMSRLALLLIDELTCAVQRPSRNEGLPPSALLRRVQEFAEARIELPHSIESLAASAGCSEASIYRVFREYLHTSPGRWLARMRAERAAMLLRTTTLAVREVGERVGYTDPFHFSRLFKRQMGVPPRAYRNSKLML